MSSRPQVLIVDDSLTVRMDLKELLEEAGCAVQDCESIASARAALAKLTPALVVVDVSLPDGDGINLVDEIRATPATVTTPIILMSGEAKAAEAFHSLATGADEFIGKPYDAAQVRETVQRLLERAGASEPAAPRPRIVLIDDSITFREALREALEQAGYEVRALDDGERGLRLIAEWRPQVVLVDSNMPAGLSGASILRHMHYDPALEHIPCLLVTGSAPDQTEREVLALGAYVYARKEEGLEPVVARVRSLLRRYRDSALQALPSLFSPKTFLAIGPDQELWERVQARLPQHQLIAVADGSQARARLEAQPFDCVLLDPGPLAPGSIGLCRQLKVWPHSRELPLILLVREEERVYGIAGVNAGADDYMLAEQHFELLPARIFAQLRRRQFERRNRQFAEERWRAQAAATEATAARELATTRAALLAELEQKNFAMEESNRQLQLLQQQKEHAISYLVHDLKNPLTLVMGHAQLIARSPQLDQAARDSIQQIHNSAQAMLRVVLNLLDVSRSDDGALRPALGEVELVGLIEGLAAAMEPLRAERGQRLQFSGPGALRMVADHELLRRMVENLLDNALKYSPAQGLIEVELREAADNRCELRVADQGPGVPHADREKIFERYFRVERGTAQHNSRGLGLSFCKIVAELHGGRLWVEPRQPAGSVFCVDLPLVAQAPTQAAR